MLRGLSEDEAAPAPAAAPVAEPVVTAKGLDDRPSHGRLHYSAPSEDGEVEERDEDLTVKPLTADQLAMARRNEPCPCLSGKKYKMCHGKNA
jgi:preprotein translocase subunit SecA